MPSQIPTLDNRRYQDLLDEALARIPVHTPEWTNFNKSDPGVTLIEVFAFMTENLLYRSNQVPERNRRTFLSLLGIGLQPAASARGLVRFANERGPLETITLNGGIEVRAGQVPFRTEKGLDVLPIEAQAYYKQAVLNPAPQLLDYYRQLYASYMRSFPSDPQPQLYQSVLLQGATGVDIGQETVDGSLWIALLTRSSDRPVDNSAKAREDLRSSVRAAIAGKTISLGIVPALTDANRQLAPGGQLNPEGVTLLEFEIPSMPADAALPAGDRRPQYRTLDARTTVDVLAKPGVVQITLPADPADLRLWSNIDPLESGVGDFPPSLDDTNLTDRIITWLRVRPPMLPTLSSAALRARVLWASINTVMVNQQAHVANEILPNGTGEPDQEIILSRTPVLPDSVRLTVIPVNGAAEDWTRIEDLASAGPEVPSPDPRQPPGTPLPTYPQQSVKVFTLDPESGTLRFGDGTRGARPPAGATLRASYDCGVGRDGNVNAGQINSSPTLPSGLTVINDIRTWGGTEAESVAEAEKQIARYLQHRDRLVTAVDFETITLRTPGVDIGRVEVIPSFNPELVPNAPGDAPGAVTLMVIPRYDPIQPDAPQPDRLFLDTICSYLDTRRLVTTEVFLRGPSYKGIWVSIGITVVAGDSVAQVRADVKTAVQRFLSPLPDMQSQATSSGAGPLTWQEEGLASGWSLLKPVIDLEVMAVANRVPGVMLVNKVLIAEGSNDPSPTIPMNGLELPRLLGISVSLGDPSPLEQLRGQAAPAPLPQQPTMLPIPVVPEECA